MKPLPLPYTLPMREKHLYGAEYSRSVAFLDPVVLRDPSEQDLFTVGGIEFDMGGWGLRVAVKIRILTGRVQWYLGALEEYNRPRNLSLVGREIPIPADGTWVAVPADSPDQTQLVVAIVEKFPGRESMYEVPFLFFADVTAPEGCTTFVKTDPLPVTGQE